MSNDQSPNLHQHQQQSSSAAADPSVENNNNKMASQNPTPPPFNSIVPLSEITPPPSADSSHTDYPALSSGNTGNTSSVACKNPTPPPPVSSAAPSGSSINPHMTHTHDSVVPDLMRVYESMTGGSANVASEQQSYHQPQDCGGNYYQPWTYEASNIPIPPIPENSFAAMTAASAAAAVAAAAASQPQDEVVSNTSNASNRGSSLRNGRSLRKRNSSAVNRTAADDDDSDNNNNNNIGSKSRRKNTRQDGRWSKRFTWPEDLHRDFVSAVFDVGLKNSSPSSVLEHMPPHEQVTTERIKSHLQKYRLHRAKSKKEFMTSYNATLAKMQKEGVATTKSLAGGEVAGHLAYVTLAGHEVSPEEVSEDVEGGPENNAGAVGSSSAPLPQTPGQPQPQQQQQDYLIFPRMSEEEKRSPIGFSMGHLMGLFFALKQQLEREREAKKSKNGSVVSNVYQSFVHGHAPDTFDSGATAAMGRGKGAVAVAPSSTRSNLEENTLMKREMQIQMAFQNKMRAMKQQEVAKYKADQQQQQHQPQYPSSAEPPHDLDLTQPPPHPHHSDGKQMPPDHMNEQQPQQGAGEHPETNASRGDDDRQRALSIGNPEDFWNTDVVDDQLFEFLMNN